MSFKEDGFRNRRAIFNVIIIRNAIPVYENWS